jgi:YjbE family integral membrane protein
MLQDMAHGPFWIGVLQIIFVNIILSGDNAVVIAMACLTLPPKQRLWGMILGAGVAVLLRVIFTLVIAQAMTYPYLKLVGGALLFYVAIKLVAEDVDGEDQGVESAQTLWRAVRIVAIADIVMSLDNVIAIAASAESAAALVDIAHASAMKATLIIFGLDRRRQRDPDGTPGALPRPGLGRRRASRLDRGRRHGRRFGVGSLAQ